MLVRDDPVMSRRLADTLYYASSLLMLTPEKRVEAAEAAGRATSWSELPKWLRDLVDMMERPQPQ